MPKSVRKGVNPNPKPFDQWIIRRSNTYGWLFSEQGHTGYWEFAWIAYRNKDGTVKTAVEVEQECRAAYELFYGKPIKSTRNAKINKKRKK